MSFKYVKIYYGPNESFHVMEHRPQKLSALRDHLRRKGYRVDMHPVEYIDMCLFEVSGHEVFRCNMSNLKFNVGFEHDEVAQRAVDAVDNAKEKFRYARLWLWLWKTIEDQMFKRSDYAPKEYWISKETREVGDAHADIRCAIDCCKILLKKQPKEDIPEINEEEDFQSFVESKF